MPGAAVAAVADAVEDRGGAETGGGEWGGERGVRGFGVGAAGDPPDSAALPDGRALSILISTGGGCGRG